MNPGYQKIQTEDGKTYMLATSREDSLKAGLAGWLAMELYGLVKQTQPGRFARMVEEGTLVPFLNSLVEQYHQKMEAHLQNGWMETEANEVEWWNLTIAAGIEQGPLKSLPEMPPPR
jgi:hypothetical protein